MVLLLLVAAKVVVMEVMPDEEILVVTENASVGMLKNETRGNARIVNDTDRRVRVIILANRF